jgi:hypothetical protein
MLHCASGFPSALRFSDQRRFMAMPPSKIASLEPTVLVPHTPSAWNKSASMATQLYINNTNCTRHMKLHPEFAVEAGCPCPSAPNKQQHRSSHGPGSWTGMVLPGGFACWRIHGYTPASAATHPKLLVVYVFLPHPHPLTLSPSPSLSHFLSLFPSPVSVSCVSVSPPLSPPVPHSLSASPLPYQHVRVSPANPLLPSHVCSVCCLSTIRPSSNDHLSSRRVFYKEQ